MTQHVPSKCIAPFMGTTAERLHKKKYHILLFLELIQAITRKSLFSFTSAVNTFVLCSGAVLLSTQIWVVLYRFIRNIYKLV